MDLLTEIFSERFIQVGLAVSFILGGICAYLGVFLILKRIIFKGLCYTKNQKSLCKGELWTNKQNWIWFINFLGIGKDDTYSDAVYIASKLINLRIFANDEKI